MEKLHCHTFLDKFYVLHGRQKLDVVSLANRLLSDWFLTWKSKFAYFHFVSIYNFLIGELMYRMPK
jgi:hypothetical protein